MNEIITKFQDLKSAPVVKKPKDETWAQMISRIKQTGQISEIKKETYNYFLDILPPQWVSEKGFAFAEGEDNIRLFWKKCGKFYCRQLTDEETASFRTAQPRH